MYFENVDLNEQNQTEWNIFMVIKSGTWYYLDLACLYTLYMYIYNLPSF